MNPTSIYIHENKLSKENLDKFYSIKQHSDSSKSEREFLRQKYETLCQFMRSGLKNKVLTSGYMSNGRLYYVTVEDAWLTLFNKSRSMEDTDLRCLPIYQNN